jgi:regulator of replication initiation timing
MDKFGENVKPAQIVDEYKEAIDIFPALHKYKVEHNTSNLQKLCVEVVEFCNSIYASTRNEEEREVYRKILSKIL